MPFTPLHMGPGLLFKALSQGSFSLMVFGWAQILMDIQPLLVMAGGGGQLHGFSHTLIGASLIGGAAIISGKYLGQLGLRLLGLGSACPIRWTVAVTSGLLGSYSHVLLDALMHADVELFFPLSDARPLLGLVSYGRLELFCGLTGALGALAYLTVIKRRHRQLKPPLC
ncbi:MAG: hypothetical protein II007_12730 [Gammaproteobacteria bacterium]|nr:hypothetical protein [Gammaproteobacteria bacterium]